jgi:hypothetical protein
MFDGICVPARLIGIAEAQLKRGTAFQGGTRNQHEARLGARKSTPDLGISPRMAV